MNDRQAAKGLGNIGNPKLPDGSTVGKQPPETIQINGKTYLIRNGTVYEHQHSYIVSEWKTQRLLETEPPTTWRKNKATKLLCSTCLEEREVNS